MQNDLISRSALKEHIGSFAGMFTDEGFMVDLTAVLAGIDYAPAVDPESLRPKGQWVRDHTYQGKHKECYVCSVCNHWQKWSRKHENAEKMKYMRYCPFCGAKMEG